MIIFKFKAILVYYKETHLLNIEFKINITIFIVLLMFQLYDHKHYLITVDHVRLINDRN